MSYNTSLYKWERISKPRVYSRTQRVTSNNDIQDWLKTVEDVSTKATAETFGTNYIAPRRQCKDSVKYAVENAQIHDAAYAEAQDLLNQWVTDKIHLDNDIDEYSEETWSKRTQADIKQEWDHLLSNDADLEMEEILSQRTRAKSKGTIIKKKNIERDPYSILYKDEEDLVNEVLDEMWQKELVDDKFKNDLELDSKKQHDPTTKMKLRHFQVKENRDKRLREKERKLKDLQFRKDSQFKARQMLMKEEKDKALHRKKEELEIQKEMTRIRKEMEYEKKKQQEEIAKQNAEEEEAASKAADQLQRQREDEMKVKHRTHNQAEARRRNLMSKMKEIETRIATDNLKIMQKYFSGWYTIVIERRLAMGKAKAMSDWKLLLRTFNGWKAYSRAKQMDRQAWTHEENLKDIQRKNNMADIYYRHRLLSKCFIAWELFVSQQQAQKNSEESNKKTKDKMAAFLEAATSGKLWTDRSQSEHSDSSRSQNSRAKNRQHLDAMFNQPIKTKGTFSMNSTARTETNDQQSKKVDTPTAGWQLTRKHLKLSKKQIQSMAAKQQALENTCTCDKTTGDKTADSNPQKCSYCSSNAEDNKSKGSKRAWEKTPYTVNNFEHRHAAQQKILEMQQKQIKEQQRLIEELQYLQKQQLLHQQLLQQEQSKKMLDNGSGTDGTATIQSTLTHLQQHIQRLQQQIIDGAGDSKGNVMDIELRDLESGDGSDSAIQSGANSRAPSSALRLDLSTVVEGETKAASTKPGSLTAKSTLSTTSTLSKAESGASSSTSRTTSTTHHPRHTQFLQTMGERAAERAQIKREREEKKRQEEELRVVELMAQEEQRKLEEEQQKKQRVEAHRERKRMEKQHEIEKQQFAEKIKILSAKADEHKQRSLVKYRGWRPWRKLIEILRDKEHRAEQHCKRALLRKCLVGWHKTVTSELEEKYQIADQFNIYITSKHAFTKWKQVKHASIIQEEKADRHYEYKLKSFVVKEWADFAAEEKVSMWHKERKAKEHSIERIRKKYFHILKSFPTMRKENEKRERRKEELRKKVAYLLPDFRASQKDN